LPGIRDPAIERPGKQLKTAAKRRLCQSSKPFSLQKHTPNVHRIKKCRRVLHKERSQITQKGIKTV
jgi:hypothetical protein